MFVKVKLIVIYRCTCCLQLAVIVVEHPINFALALTCLYLLPHPQFSLGNVKHVQNIPEGEQGTKGGGHKLFPKSATHAFEAWGQIPHRDERNPPKRDEGTIKANLAVKQPTYYFCFSSFLFRFYALVEKIATFQPRVLLYLQRST